jgi:hypothetical protein
LRVFFPTADDPLNCRPAWPETSYNANRVLVDAIRTGYREAYWDILRRISDSKLDAIKISGRIRIPEEASPDLRRTPESGRPGDNRKNLREGSSSELPRCVL